MQQAQFNFDEIILQPQNNRESEDILVAQSKRLSKNCQTLLDALNRGERLTGIDIITKYKMVEYRRRLKDIIDSGVKVEYKIHSNGCKEWWIENK